MAKKKKSKKPIIQQDFNAANGGIVRNEAHAREETGNYWGEVEADINAQTKERKKRGSHTFKSKKGHANKTPDPNV